MGRIKSNEAINTEFLFVKRKIISLQYLTMKDYFNLLNTKPSGSRGQTEHSHLFPVLFPRTS